MAKRKITILSTEPAARKIQEQIEAMRPKPKPKPKIKPKPKKKKRGY